MSNSSSENVPKLGCKLFGHRWRHSHRLDVVNGKNAWVYTDHVCIRCYCTEYRLPNPKSRVVSSAAVTL